MDPVKTSRYRRFRVQVFVSTWLSYVGFYFCRHAFYVVKPELTKQLGLDASSLGDVGLVYLIAYTIGQFVSAGVGQRVGARILLLVGMALSMAANIAFGFANGLGTFMVFMAFNGLAQATGWPGNIGTMAHWFRRRERGTVFGFWATCYQVGGALAKGFAAFMLGLWGWRWSFFGATMVLGGIWLIFLLLQRNQPEDVGLPPVEDPEEAADEDDEAAGEGGGWTRETIITVGIIGLSYFFIKFIRYALWSWGTYFLSLNYGMAGDEAGYFSTIFDVAGFFGVITAGILSDRVFKGRRTPISLIMLTGLAAVSVVLYLWGGHSLIVFGISFGFMGFMLYGPDAMLSGAAAMDTGGGRMALAAAGIINGLGSAGSVAQEKTIGWLYDAGRWGLTDGASDTLASVTGAVGHALASAVGARGEMVAAILPARAAAVHYGPALQNIEPIFLILSISAFGAALTILFLFLHSRAKGRLV